MCVAGGRMSTDSVVAGGTAADSEEAISSRMVGLSRLPSEPSCGCGWFSFRVAGIQGTAAKPTA